MVVTDLGCILDELQYTVETRQTNPLLPWRPSLKSAEKHLVPFVVLVAVTWVFLSLGMELFAH